MKYEIKKMYYCIEFKQKREYANVMMAKVILPLKVILYHVVLEWFLMPCFWSDSLSVILPNFTDKETEAWKSCMSFPIDTQKLRPER